MNKKRYNSNAKRRGLRPAALGLTITPDGEVTITPYVANQIKQQFGRSSPIISGIRITKTIRTIRGRGKPFQVERDVVLPFKPIGKDGRKKVDTILRAVTRWAYLQYLQFSERGVMQEANQKHRRASTRLFKAKKDKYRKNGTVKEGLTSTQHAQLVNRCQELQPPLALIGLEMVRQRFII